MSRNYQPASEPLQIYSTNLFPNPPLLPHIKVRPVCYFSQIFLGFCPLSPFSHTLSFSYYFGESLGADRQVRMLMEDAAAEKDLEAFRNVILQNSVPTKNLRLIYISNDEKLVDGFVGELISATRLEKIYL